MHRQAARAETEIPAPRSQIWHLRCAARGSADQPLYVSSRSMRPARSNASSRSPSTLQHRLRSMRSVSAAWPPVRHRRPAPQPPAAPAMAMRGRTELQSCLSPSATSSNGRWHTHSLWTTVLFATTPSLHPSAPRSGCPCKGCTGCGCGARNFTRAASVRPHYGYPAPPSTRRGRMARPPPIPRLARTTLSCGWSTSQGKMRLLSCCRRVKSTS
mmetsp:Transcript_24673/g.77532  ORF Transcript_24673/g.77532 Transcript_24673/m.77532 type:complete len:214 (-) Transcript_24673:829-1470(-)